MVKPEWLIPASGGQQEFYTDERCYITELLNCEQSPQVSVAQARVEPGVTTQRHKLEGVAETYVLTQGAGLMEVGDEQHAVKTGDTVVIPAGVAQRISNNGDVDLVFYCVCTPRFEPSCYVNLEA
jgi:mannose-6-phosphate isomerase-like protein (cupin superfamily)